MKKQKLMTYSQWKRLEHKRKIKSLKYGIGLFLIMFASFIWLPVVWFLGY